MATKLPLLSPRATAAKRRRRTSSQDPDSDEIIRQMVGVLVFDLQKAVNAVKTMKDIPTLKTQSNKVLADFQSEVEQNLKTIDLLGKKAVVLNKLKKEYKKLETEHQEAIQRAGNLESELQKLKAELKQYKPSETAALNKSAVDEHDLPPTLRTYTALMDKPEIGNLARSKDLLTVSKTLTKAPTDVDCQNKLSGHIKQLSAVYSKILGQRMREENIALKCKQVVVDGNRAFRDVYTTLWATIRENEPKDIEKYCAYTATLKFPAVRVKQKHKTIVELYCAAALVKKEYKRFVIKIVRKLESEGKLKVKDLLIPKGLKKIPRIVEKTLLREDDPGNCDCVSDIVRGMVVLKHMCDVTTLLQALYECEEIEMTRMKERFERAPSDGVWIGFCPHGVF